VPCPVLALEQLQQLSQPLVALLLLLRATMSVDVEMLVGVGNIGDIGVGGDGTASVPGLPADGRYAVAERSDAFVQIAGVGERDTAGGSGARVGAPSVVEHGVGPSSLDAGAGAGTPLPLRSGTSTVVASGVASLDADAAAAAAAASAGDALAPLGHVELDVHQVAALTDSHHVVAEPDRGTTSGASMREAQHEARVVVGDAAAAVTAADSLSASSAAVVQSVAAEPSAAVTHISSGDAATGGIPGGDVAAAPVTQPATGTAAMGTPTAMHAAAAAAAAEPDVKIDKTSNLSSPLGSPAAAADDDDAASPVAVAAVGVVPDGVAASHNEGGTGDASLSLREAKSGAGDDAVSPLRDAATGGIPGGATAAEGTPAAMQATVVAAAEPGVKNDKTSTLSSPLDSPAAAAASAGTAASAAPAAAPVASPSVVTYGRARMTPEAAASVIADFLQVSDYDVEMQNIAKGPDASGGEFSLPATAGIDLDRRICAAPVVPSPPAFDVDGLALVIRPDPDVEPRRAAVPFDAYIPALVRLARVPERSDVPPELVLEGPRALLSGPVPNAAGVRYIMCDGITDDAARRGFVAAVNACVSCEVLVCRGSRLSKIEGLRLPHALAIDLSNNALDSAKHVVSMVAASPRLQLLDLTGNRVAAQWVLLPSGVPGPGSPVWNFITSLPDLRTLNRVAVSGHGVSVTALQKAKGDAARAWQMRAWDDVMASRLDLHVASGTTSTWAPAAVTALSVVACGLSAVFLGGLTGLTSLDVSSNRIVALSTTGVHSCLSLRELHASGNAIRDDKKEIEYLGLLPNVFDLALSGNPISTNKRYRQHVLWATRGASGTRVQRGLGVLDGAPVSYEELCAVARTCAAPAAHAEAMCWSAALVAAVGQGVACSIDACAALVVICVPKRGLTVLDLSGCPRLEVLDARDNNLSTEGIVSLRSCPQLKTLNLQVGLGAQ
jgi:hypothetical protein